MEQMDRGVTVLSGKGAYSGENKFVLMCAFKQKEIVELKEIIFDVDPKAFIIVCDAHEVTGNGFKTYDTATPEWSGRYGIRYARTLNQDVDFRLDVYGRSQSATKYKSADGSADYELGGFTTANLALGFDFGSEKQYSLTAELLNIFDKTYQYNQAILEPGVHANLKFVYRF